MANFYDVNAAIEKPNFVNAMREGIVFGQQQRQRKQEEQDRNALRSLTPQAIAGEFAAQDQMAAIDPQRAQQAQGMGQARWGQLKGAYELVERARKTGDRRQVDAALRSTAPFFSRMVGKPAPEAWSDDPGFLDGWNELGAVINMRAGPQPAGPGGKVVGNALVDPTTGQVIYQGQEAPANGQMVSVPDGRGGMVQMIFDPRTRQLSEPNYPSSQPPAAAPATGDGYNAPSGPVTSGTAEQIVAQIEAAQGSPLAPEVRAQIIRDVQREGGRVDTGSFNQGAIKPPPMGAPGAGTQPQGRMGYTPPKAAPAGAGPVVTLSPQEVAANGFPPGSVVQRKPDGTLVKTFSPTERDTNGGRALPANVVNDLSKDAEKLTTLTDLVGSFRPEFAGNVVGGTMENFAGRLGGERLGIASQGQADWWQQYDRLKNVVRNELFGAALTATEQAAFEAADITPNMDPKIVASNLAKQGEIVRRALDRKAAVWKSQGYNPDAVINATAVAGPASSGAGRSAAELSDDELKRELGL